MHMIIRNIVYADSEEQAITKAKENFENLCEGQRPFDYYDLFTEGGSGYWGDKYLSVAKADSIEGRKMVVGGWRATLKDMYIHLKRIEKKMKTRKITELISDMRKEFLQYDFYAVGEYIGSNVWLYDDDGEGIKTREHLNSALYEWNEGKGVYVVPADVHY